jgi:hypothetical protein
MPSSRKLLTLSPYLDLVKSHMFTFFCPSSVPEATPHFSKILFCDSSSKNHTKNSPFSNNRNNYLLKHQLHPQRNQLIPIPLPNLSNMTTNLHLRSELGKALEHRSALTPTTTKKLIDAGYHIAVERSPQRIFEDKEFEAVGATLVDENTWREAPKDTIIVGLKELPVETCESNYLSQLL